MDEDFWPDQETYNFGGSYVDPLVDSLALLWKFNEGSGVALDDSGNNYTGTDNNAVGSGTGKVNGARDFEQSSSQQFSRTGTGHSPLLDFGSNVPMTFTLWVNLESLGTWDIFGKWGAAGSRSYLLVYNNGTARFEWYVSTDGTAQAVRDATTFGAPSAATWYFLAGGYDLTNIWISVNDGTKDTTAFSAGIKTTPDIGFGVGARLPGVGQYYDGLMDALYIWRRALTNAEITRLYNAGAGLEI